jgi:hypothetical protein
MGWGTGRPERSGAGGGDVGGKWVRHWRTNWKAVTAPGSDHNLDTGGDGTFVDPSGVSIGIGGDGITGETFADILAIKHSLGIHIRTSGDGNILFDWAVQDIIADYAWGQRLAFLVKLACADQNSSFNNLWLHAGDPTWANASNRLWRAYDAGTKLRQKRKGGGGDSANYDLDTAFHDVLGLELVGESMRGHYGAAMPAAPFTGLTAGKVQSFQADPATGPWVADSDLAVSILANQNGGSAMNVYVEETELWRFE